MKEKDRHLNIEYIVNLRMPTEKAHGLQIAKTCEALSKLGHSVHLVVPRRHNPIRTSVSEYYSLQKSFPVQYLSIPDVIRFSNILGSVAYWVQSFMFFIRLVFFRAPQSSWIYTRNPEIAFLFKLKGHQVVFEAHAWPQRKQSLFVFLLSRTNYIICNSEGTRMAFEDAGFQHTLVAPNGVDVEFFERAPVKYDARNKLGLPQEKDIILYTGALYEWKGVDFALQSWIHAFKDDNSKLLVFVGGNQKDRLRLQRNISGADNVEFRLAVAYARIPTYLSAADVLILPNVPVTEESEFFTSPIKLFEYMASGRPIVASDLPSVTEILSQDTAFLFNPQSTDDFVQQITKALDNADLAEKRAEKARIQVMKYSWEKRAIRITSILRSTVTTASL